MIRGGSGPKNRAEHHGNVHFGVAPQKPTKNCKKPIFSANLDKHLIFLFFAQKTSNFQAPTTLGGQQNNEKPKLKKIEKNCSENRDFRNFC